MQEYRVTAVVLKATNYKEKDKLVTLFTLELGKISALLKGVNNPKAKLKFAAQPFCFATFELVKRGVFYIVTQVDTIDSFYNLTLQYDDFLEGSYLLKLCGSMQEGVVSQPLFLMLINALKFITYNEANTDIVVAKFLMEYLQATGYQLDFNTCSNCKSKLYSGHISLAQGFVCDNCFNYQEVGFTKQEFGLFKILYSTPITKIKNIKIKDDVAAQLTKVLKTYTEYTIKM